MKSEIVCLFVLVLASQFKFYKCVAYPVAQVRDEFGQTNFGYAHPGQAATNLRDGFGNQIGSYAYINPEGKQVRVSYTADSRGFRVISNDLPVYPIVPNFLARSVKVDGTPKLSPTATDLPAVPVLSGFPPSFSEANLQKSFGNKIGKYSYTNPEGKEVSVSYTADTRGFRVRSIDLNIAPVANLVAPVQLARSQDK